MTDVKRQHPDEQEQYDYDCVRLLYSCICLCYHLFKMLRSRFTVWIPTYLYRKYNVLRNSTRHEGIFACTTFIHLISFLSLSVQLEVSRDHLHSFQRPHRQVLIVLRRQFTLGMCGCTFVESIKTCV